MMRCSASGSRSGQPGKSGGVFKTSPLFSLLYSFHFPDISRVRGKRGAAAKIVCGLRDQFFGTPTAGIEMRIKRSFIRIQRKQDAL